MKLAARIIFALMVAVAMFWLTRFGGWVGSLTTERTPFYWTLNHICSWVVAVLVFVMGSLQKWDAK